MAKDSTDNPGKAQVRTAPLSLDSCSFRRSPNMRGMSSSVTLEKSDGKCTLTVMRRGPFRGGGKLPEETHAYLVPDGEKVLERIAGIVREHGMESWEGRERRPAPLDASVSSIDLAAGEKFVSVSAREAPLDEADVFQEIREILEALAVPECEIKAAAPVP